MLSGLWTSGSAAHAARTLMSAVIHSGQRLHGRQALLPNACLQVRTSFKIPRVKREDYGVKPFYTDHKLDEVFEDDTKREVFAYQEVRFPLPWENNSPLTDDVLEKYINFMMHDGRRHLVYELMHKTFYEIKLAQFRRLLKKRKQAEASKSTSDTKEIKKQESTTVDIDEDSGEEIELNPMALFHKAVENCKPVVVTKPIRRGGATYQVPFPLRANQSEYLAMSWLNKMIKERPKPREKHYYEELAWEIIEAAQGRGKVVKKRDDIHKLAQANKAYSHYRWG